MFDIFAKLLSSIASFLFPVFASYKALKTSDLAELTPWLMYWVVLAIVLLVESWTEWLLFWVPFYAYLRLLFMLYLVLPQTQGARVIYQTHVHPWLEENESAIEDLIASAHDRLRTAGISYIKQALELLKTRVLGLPPSPEAANGTNAPPASAAPQSYTQALLARFSLPSARWDSINNGAATGASDFYNLLATAVSAATSAAAAGVSGNNRGPSDASGSAAAAGRGGNVSSGSTSTLIPESIRGARARMSFIAAQRERLNILLSALDREATQLQTEEAERGQNRPPSMSMDGGRTRNQSQTTGAAVTGGGASPHQRPLSGLSKSRSEQDFEKLEAESGAEDFTDTDSGDAGGSSRRTTPAAPSRTMSSNWMPWGWGGPAPAGKEAGKED